MHTFAINPLLAYSQHNADAAPLPDQPRQIKWDLRQSSVNARRTNPDEPVTFADLTSAATQPPLDNLHITCGMLSEGSPEGSPIIVNRPEGITVADVFEALRAALLHRISHTEYAAFSESQQHKIAEAFEARCSQAPDPVACRQNGVLRVDCLLQHTMFAGLSVSTDTPDTCILSLRRRPDHRRSTSAESQTS